MALTAWKLLSFWSSLKARLMKARKGRYPGEIDFHFPLQGKIRNNTAGLLYEKLSLSPMCLSGP